VELLAAGVSDGELPSLELLEVELELAGVESAGVVVLEEEESVLGEELGEVAFWSEEAVSVVEGEVELLDELDEAGVESDGVEEESVEVFEAGWGVESVGVAGSDEGVELLDEDSDDVEGEVEEESVGVVLAPLSAAGSLLAGSVVFASCMLEAGSKKQNERTKMVRKSYFFIR
jgi:hypothetical protein